MKCRDCRIKLKDYYYPIGAIKLCKTCALSLMSDISYLKTEIKKEKEGISNEQ